MPSESTSYTFMFSVTKILLANDDFNYAGVLNGYIVFQIAREYNASFCRERTPCLTFRVLKHLFELSEHISRLHIVL